MEIFMPSGTECGQKKSHTHRLIEIANIGVHNREERDPKNLLPRLTEQATVLVTTYHLKYNTPSTTPVHLYYHGAEEKNHYFCYISLKRLLDSTEMKPVREMRRK